MSLLREDVEHCSRRWTHTRTGSGCLPSRVQARGYILWFWGAWRKYPVPGRGLPPTCSPVPGFVIAQESVCQLVMWLMHTSQEHHGREEGSAALLPARAWPACGSFYLSAAPLSFGSRVPVEPPGETVLGGPHQSEEAGAEQRAWDASQGGPVLLTLAIQGPQAEGLDSSEPPIPDLNLGLVTPPPR